MVSEINLGTVVANARFRAWHQLFKLRSWQTAHWSVLSWVYTVVPIVGWVTWQWWMGRLYGDIIGSHHHAIGTAWAVVLWLNYLLCELIVTFIGARWLYRKTGVFGRWV